MYDISNPMVIRELNRIRDQDPEGILRAEAVVQAARPKSSILHKYFEWDDSEAAAEYRLIQAGHLVRCVVKYVRMNGDRRAIRVFTSLRPDRTAGGGYRAMVDVMSNKSLRMQLLADARAELLEFEKKYKNLGELSEVFAASKKFQKELKLVLTDN